MKFHWKVLLWMLAGVLAGIALQASEESDFLVYDETSFVVQFEIIGILNGTDKNALLKPLLSHRPAARCTEV